MKYIITEDEMSNLRTTCCNYVVKLCEGCPIKHDVCDFINNPVDMDEDDT